MEAIIGWSGIYGPPKLPEPVVAKWVDTLQKLKTNKAWLKFTRQLGSVPDVRSPADTKAFVQGQYTTFKDVVTKLGISIGNSRAASSGAAGGPARPSPAAAAR